MIAQIAVFLALLYIVLSPVIHAKGIAKHHAREAKVSGNPGLYGAPMPGEKEKPHGIGPAWEQDTPWALDLDDEEF